MTYLASAEYAAFGLAGVDPAQVQAAERVVNSYIRRPEGVVWAPDYQGAPAYMAGATPSYSVTAGLQAGINTVACPNATASYLGEAVVIDRTGQCEVAVVTSAGPGTITLSPVKLAHANATIEFGLTLTHEAELPEKRSVTRLYNTPVARVFSGIGKYGLTRRSTINTPWNPTVLGALTPFGGPTPWVAFDVTQIDLSPATGDVWIPPGLLLAYFTHARLRYVAGYPQASVPADIKQAVAAITLAGIDNPFAGNLKVHKQGDATLERFAASALDADTVQLLNPYRNPLFG